MSENKLEIDPNESNIDAVIAPPLPFSAVQKEQRIVFNQDITALQYEINQSFVTIDLSLRIILEIARIESFENYPKGWDSYGAESPNEIAIKNAVDALRIFANHALLPEKINPSSEEGIIFEFLIDSNYYLFEFFNDGDIVFLKREEHNPKAFEIGQNEIESKILEMKYGQYNIDLR